MKETGNIKTNTSSIPHAVCKLSIEVCIISTEIRYIFKLVRFKIQFTLIIN